MRINKNVAIAAGGAVLLVSLVLLLMPQERADAISTYIKRSTGDMGIICLDYYKNNFKDPDSAKLVDSIITKDEIETISIVKIKYKAKNSYGAYVTSEEECTFNDGKIHETLTNISRELKRLKLEVK